MSKKIFYYYYITMCYQVSSLLYFFTTALIPTILLAQFSFLSSFFPHRLIIHINIMMLSMFCTREYYEYHPICPRAMSFVLDVVSDQRSLQSKFGATLQQVRSNRTLTVPTVCPAGDTLERTLLWKKPFYWLLHHCSNSYYLLYTNVVAIFSILIIIKKK